MNPLLKTYEIILDIEKEIYNPSMLLFNISRNDFESIELTFLISQDDIRLDLNNSTVELAVKKPSGLTVYQPCEITNASQGEAKVKLSMQAYIEYGVHMAELYIRNVDQLIVTSPFWYASRAAIMENESIDSINEWSALQQALFAYDLKPIITNGFPTEIPEYIGQLAFDSVNKNVYIANDLTSISWQLVGAGEGGAGGNDDVLGIGVPTNIPSRIGQVYIDTEAHTAYIATGATAGDWEQIDGAGLTSVAWDDITDLPIVFPADLSEPALLALFNEKADINHNHDADYAPLVHNHDLTYSPINHNHDLTYSPINHNHDADYAPLVHNHDASYYKKTETYSALEVDNIVEGVTQGGGTVVTDNLTSNSTTSALSANQGRILKNEVDSKADLIHNHDSVYAPLIHNHDLVYAPLDHNHTSSEITDFNSAVSGQITTALSGYVPTIPAEYLTETEGNTNYAPKVHNHDLVYSPINHNHDTVYAPLVHNHDTSYYKKAETYSALEVDNIIEGVTQGGGTVVVDNLTSNSTTAALSANQGRVLKGEVDSKADSNHNHDLTYAPLDHNHTSTDLTDFGTAVDGRITTALSTYTPTIPAEYLTETEGNTNYAPKVHNHDLVYAPIDHNHESANITDFGTAVDGRITTALSTYVPTIPTEYLTETEGNANYAPKVHNHDLAYAPLDHDHTSTEITDFGTAVDGRITTALSTYVPTIPAEYLTETEGNTNYAPKVHNHDTVYAPLVHNHDLTYAPLDHNHTSTDLTDFGTAVDGRITTALSTYVPTIPAEYLTETEGNTNYAPKVHNHDTVYAPIDHNHDINDVTDLSNTLNSKVTNANGVALLWSGTQAEYDLLTKDPTTLYFITG